MNRSWRTVSHGLRLVLIGAQIVGWSLAAAFAIGCGGFAIVNAGSVGPDGGAGVLILLVAALVPLVLGRLLCTVGRYYCLATPTDAPTALAAIRLAVIFETCGILCGTTTAVVGTLSLGVPWIPLVGAVFSLFAFVIGRLSFIRYLQGIGDATRNRTLADDTRRMFRISIGTVTSAVLGVLFLAVGDVLKGDDRTILLCRLFCTVTGGMLIAVPMGFPLYLVPVYFIHVAEAKRAAEGYTTAPTDDDPDRTYRERHLAAGGSEDE